MDNQLILELDGQITFDLYLCTLTLLKNILPCVSLLLL